MRGVCGSNTRTVCVTNVSPSSRGGAAPSALLPQTPPPRPPPARTAARTLCMRFHSCMLLQFNARMFCMRFHSCILLQFKVENIAHGFHSGVLLRHEVQQPKASTLCMRLHS